MGARVLSLSWINPFPLLVRGPPVRSELSWWDPGRTFSAQRHPRPETLFRDVDFVMIPKFNYNAQTTRLMVQIYGRHLQRNYELLEENGCWKLLGRRQA